MCSSSTPSTRRTRRSTGRSRPSSWRRRRRRGDPQCVQVRPRVRGEREEVRGDQGRALGGGGGGEEILNVFKFDPEYEENEKKYGAIKAELLEEEEEARRSSMCSSSTPSTRRTRRSTGRSRPSSWRRRRRRGDPQCVQVRPRVRGEREEVRGDQGRALGG